MVAETEYEVPTWSQIYDMLLSQARKISCDGYKPDIIVGIARGGLVPFRILADLLETRDLAVITIEYYVGIAQKTREPILKQCLHTTLTGKKVLRLMMFQTAAEACSLPRSILRSNAPNKSRWPPSTVNPAP